MHISVHEQHRHPQFRYLPFEKEIDSPHIGLYHTLGPRALLSQDGLEEEAMLLPDISTDFSFVSTRLQHDPIALMSGFRRCLFYPLNPHISV